MRASARITFVSAFVMSACLTAFAGPSNIAVSPGISGLVVETQAVGKGKRSCGDRCQDRCKGKSGKCLGNCVRRCKS
jgi:hypothetical protein